MTVPIHVSRTALVISLAVPLASPVLVHGQAAADYPVRPVPLADAEEIALATSAAPAEMSSRATVYAVRDGRVVKLREGSNRCACMVSRDLHRGSQYPICFDFEASRTVIFRELMENALRSVGKSEDEVRRAVSEAYQRGDLRIPARPSVAYMMSRRQVLFSSPDQSGVRIGAWSPHIMIYWPHIIPEELGLAPHSAVSTLTIDDPGTIHSQVIIKVRDWADSAMTAAERR